MKYNLFKELQKTATQSLTSHHNGDILRHSDRSGGLDV